ncbi:MAG TPA: glycosyltransferase [Terracidiphilus sp.]|nr:glycosyltransferase [Terracidiphilus sp.]
MATLGAFCFPGTGHLNPLTALARRLQQRGHTVIIFGIADVEARVRAAGIDFCLIGQSDYPLGTLQKLDQRLGEMTGAEVLRFTMDRVCNTARMVLRDGLDAVRNANLDALLVDEADMANNIAEYLGLPFISLALIPPMVNDNRYPPFYFGWSGSQRWWARARNEIAIRILTRVARPIFDAVNEYRVAWGMNVGRIPGEGLSKLAQITQLPRALEFDIEPPPPHLYYTGPFVDAVQRPPVDFPWDQLDGRPLVFASLGTLQNQSRDKFQMIAEACAPLDVQLVMSLGGGLTREQLGPLTGNPLVVNYAPQLEIVKRATAVITHAGLNTVLESLAEGVPMVCIPLGNDQPGVAARVKAHGAGIVIHPRKVNAKRLRSAVRKVMEEDSYRRAARKIQSAIAQIDGPGQAADIIEDVLNIRKT